MELKTINKFTSQHKLEKEYGINKYNLAYLMRNFMHIPTQVLEAMDTYRMQHMHGNLFAYWLHDGLIESLGTKYSVIYHGCNPFNAKRAIELRLSFRAAKPEFNIDPIVLIQIAQEA